jgi:hypothetical protein
MSKKKVAGLAVVALILVSIAVAIALPSREQLGSGGGDAIAVVRLSGPIQEAGSGSLFGGGAITPSW